MGWGEYGAYSIFYFPLFFSILFSELYKKETFNINLSIKAWKLQKNITQHTYFSYWPYYTWSVPQYSATTDAQSTASTLSFSFWTLSSCIWGPLLLRRRCSSERFLARCCIDGSVRWFIRGNLRRREGNHTTWSIKWHPDWKCRLISRSPSSWLSMEQWSPEFRRISIWRPYLWECFYRLQTRNLWFSLSALCFSTCSWLS